MSDFARFRAAHGIRPQDAWTDGPWHHASAETPPPDGTQAITLRSLSGALLAQLPASTEALHLGWCPDLCAAHLHALARLPRLRWLYIDHPHHLQLDVAALAVLAALPLEVLALRARPEDTQAHLEDDALTVLSAHPTLRLLVLRGLPHLAGLALLQTLPRLDCLDLTDSRAPDVWPQLPDLRHLYLDGPLPLPPRPRFPAGLDTLSLCGRRWPREAPPVPLQAQRLLLWGGQRLPPWAELLHPDTVSLDLAGLSPPPPDAIGPQRLPHLRALRRGQGGLRAAHREALLRLETLWLGEGGSAPHRLRPADWAVLGQTRLRHLTLDGAPWSASHLAAIATHSAQTLETLVVLSGASAMRAEEVSGALAPLAGRGVQVHLEGAAAAVCAAVQAQLPDARLTYRPGTQHHRRENPVFGAPSEPPEPQEDPQEDPRRR